MTDTNAAASNLVPFPRGAEVEVVPAPPASAVAVPGADPPSSSEELSTGKKVLVGAGVATGVGLLAYGLFRFGEHSGWWGDGGGLIIDDPAKGPKDSSDGKGDSNKADGGGSKASGRAVGNPPNMSGDPEGYNTALFPSALAVRMAMRSLGYSVEIEAAALVGHDETHGEVQRFQADWNRVIRGIDSGKVKLPSSVAEAAMLRMYRGQVSADDVPGKYTLRAIEIAVRNSLANKVRFHELRKAAK